MLLSPDSRKLLTTSIEYTKRVNKIEKMPIQDDEPLLVAYQHRNISNISRSLRFLPLFPNVELFIMILRAEPEILKEARNGNTSLFEDFPGCSSVMLTYFCTRFSQICRLPFYFLVALSSPGTRITEILARKQPAGLFIIIY